MKNGQIKEKNDIYKTSYKKNIKIMNSNILENLSFSALGNIHNKQISKKENLSNINNNKSLALSKIKLNNPTIDGKIKILTQSKKESQEAKNNKKEKKIENNQKSYQAQIENTKKIDYRYYSNYPIKEIPLFDDDKEKEYFWLATYDKLIKKKKLFKIFSFYNVASRASMVVGNEEIYNDFSKIKEKKMIINNYELYFIEKHNKPFIRKCNEKYIYTKLYLLSLKQINMIFSYLNRIEYKPYINNLIYFSEKDTFKKISEFGNQEEYNDINYSAIYCLGSYMNIKIYGFSRIENKEEMSDNYNIGVDNYPNSKKIAKLIKLLMINFPENTKEHFINYIFNDSHTNGLNKKMLTDKKNEINHLLISKKKSLYKANSKVNSIIQNIAPGIQEFSFSPYFSSNTYNHNLNTNNKLSNINNNLNTNNNLATISYNTSNFDFTSDFFNSLRQNSEPVSKELDSIRSISNQNWRNKTIFKNYNSNNNNQNKTVKNNKTNKDNNNNKVSNFSFENDSKTSNHYIKIDISNNINTEINNAKKDTLKKIESYSLPKSHTIRTKIMKKNININVNKNLVLNQSSKNGKNSKYFSENTEHILEDNKENYNSSSNLNKSNNTQNIKKVSDFTIIKVRKKSDKNMPKKGINKNILMSNNSSSINKTFLRGEDIFRTTNFWNSKNKSGIHRIIQNGVKSSDYKNLRENPLYKNYSINFLKK